jgi:FKBP-type peptidyl-prolyl cis-trans isomerase
MKNLTMHEKIGVAVGILVVGFFFIFGGTIINIFNSGQLNSSANPTQNMQDTSTDLSTDTSSTTAAEVGAPTQLGIQDTFVGTGAVAVPGETVTVNYVGMLSDGTVFDSSVARNQPFSFQLGAGQVIAGWDQGVAGMKVGGKRVLTIPPDLGYGPQTYGPIPGGSTLIFQVELLSVKK